MPQANDSDGMAGERKRGKALDDQDTCLQPRDRRSVNFFAIFLEFSILLRVGTKRNDTFYILSFPAFSIRFWLEMKP